MLLKLGRDVAPYKIYPMVQILMLLWQHARFQSPACSKLNCIHLVISFLHLSSTYWSLYLIREDLQKNGPLLKGSFLDLCLMKNK